MEKLCPSAVRRGMYSCLPSKLVVRHANCVRYDNGVGYAIGAIA